MSSIVENNYHLGKAIRAELDRQQRSVTWFARQICCARPHVYRIFEKDNLDIKLLLRICKVLNYNFFDDISREFVSLD